MARGWESKSVEIQIEAAQSKGLAAVQMGADEAARHRERDGLLLSRTRVLRDMEASLNPRYREILKAALDHLDKRLAEL